MNKILREKLVVMLGTDDIDSYEFPVMTSENVKGINYHNVRGSVRMANRMVATPGDIAKRRAEILAIPLP